MTEPYSIRVRDHASALHLSALITSEHPSFFASHYRDAQDHVKVMTDAPRHVVDSLARLIGAV